MKLLRIYSTLVIFLLFVLYIYIVEVNELVIDCYNANKEFFINS